MWGEPRCGPLARAADGSSSPDPRCLPDPQLSVQKSWLPDWRVILRGVIAMPGHHTETPFQASAHIVPGTPAEIPLGGRFAIRPRSKPG